MSRKFMSVKKIVLPLLTLVVLVSQLRGVPAMTSQDIQEVGGEYGYEVCLEVANLKKANPDSTRSYVLEVLEGQDAENGIRNTLAQLRQANPRDVSFKKYDLSSNPELLERLYKLDKNSSAAEIESAIAELERM